jgi:AcrR family transcriptional regulator
MFEYGACLAHPFIDCARRSAAVTMSLTNVPFIATGPGATMVKRRQTKSEQTRQRILIAAAKIVGAIGYAKASVTLITSEAKIASGGFYYYFNTRDDLFDELLPALGQEMIAFISDSIKDVEWGIEHEVRSFEAYLAYLKKRPEFYRVFSEAYVYAPKAYKKHFTVVIENYVTAFNIQKKKGHVFVKDEEMMLLVYFLIGIRNYVSQLYMERGAKKDLSPETAVELYRKLIMGEIFRTSTSVEAAPIEAKPKRSRPPKALVEQTS